MRGTRVNVAFLLGLALFALAAGPATAEDAGDQELFEKLHLVTSAVTLRDGLATVKVGPDFAYLNPDDAEIFLTQIWPNEKGSGTQSLGLLVPRDIEKLGDDGWAIILDYIDDGYVSDADAKTIDYDKLLKEMQRQTEEESTEWKKRGRPGFALVGWAKRPHYDPETHKLYWAKRLRFDDNAEDTLNYNVRALGRNGVLELNVVASLDQLPMVDRRLPEILSMVSFNAGHTYAEYDSKIDTAAGYTIAGVIAGGVLAKVGFFKALWLGILAFKKLIFAGAVAAIGAVSAFLKRLFARRTPPTIG